jgi:hypothetical protein
MTHKDYRTNRIRARSLSAGGLTLAYASGSDRNPSEPEA